MGIGDKLKQFVGMDEDDDFMIEEQDTEIKEAPVKPKKSYSDQSSASGKMQFVLVKPERFDECLDIGAQLLDNKTVVLNLESTAKDISRRIVDFLGGIAFALKGQIKKVSVATYIIIPFNADISGETLDELDNTGNIYF